ncbi:MAG: hypothetical protein H0W89_06525 [Candidatus Levybacteria bacterium]|nr:hypothetical protein [Candidatus Levybacteria bacterium]
MSEGINLLDANKKNENILPVRRIHFMRIMAVSMLFVVSVSAVIVFILIALSPLPELQRQEQSLRLNLSNSSADMAKLALLDERTSVITKLLSERTSYDQTIGLLQDTLPDNATISSLRVEGDILVVTVESRSLQALDTFLNGLINYVQEKKGFSQVMLSSLSSDNVSNDYSLTVHLILL